MLPECTREISGNLMVRNPEGDIVYGKCKPKCKTCSGNSDRCDICKIAENRSQETPNCSCLPGFHDENSSNL
jgi:hypothetical protein